MAHKKSGKSGIKVIEITLDSKLSYLMNSPHPFFDALNWFSNAGTVRVHTFDNSAERVESLHPSEIEIVKRIAYPEGKPETLDDHSNLVLLADHMREERDYFVTSDQSRLLKRASEFSRLGIRMRPADSTFLENLRKEIDSNVPVE